MAEQTEKTIVISNQLPIERTNEVVQIDADQLLLEDGEEVEAYGLADDSGQLQLIQYLDQDQNGTTDAILFQPGVPADGQVSYTLKKLAPEEQNPSSEKACFSRFVPERTDDYAWENDRVAFRTFGPTAQQMKESGEPGGTLTSGIDCWLKKVDYPIINKWYKKYKSDPNAYHVDSGEGLDNFHVGISRGCGGIAVKFEDQFYTSKNFTAYNTLTNGSLRTAFSLEYATWFWGDSNQVKTSKKNDAG
ncbi:DUF4861 family protein [Reichenbachiella sp.]|uniref:DUF4861 family protein n=1 Tax=Reichenbachiella sp. TaxID=2184521 RepID=UPI003B5A41E3